MSQIGTEMIQLYSVETLLFWSRLENTFLEYDSRPTKT